MNSQRIRHWQWIHKWSSVICTLFLLMLCLTGLPLIFHDEIDAWLGDTLRAPERVGNPAHVSLDHIVDDTQRRYPREFIRFIVFSDDDPDVVRVLAAPERDPKNPKLNHRLWFDLRTGALLGETGFGTGVMNLMEKLHIELLLGLPGELFLGAMGILFIVAIVSGIALYRPFMRKLEFGTVRKAKSRRTFWLDIHDLLGVTTLCWVLVVSVTGVLNTVSQPLVTYWRSTELAAIFAPYRGRSTPPKLSSAQAALDLAMRTSPGNKPLSIVFPGAGIIYGKSHYAVFLHGDTPVTSTLFKPTLIDAANGTLTAAVGMPWYLRMVLLSRPLHFGDYGGTAFKIVWAALDLATIIVMCSGLYLWLAPRAKPAKHNVKERHRTEDASVALSSADANMLQ